MNSRRYWIVGPGRMGLSLGTLLDSVERTGDIVMVGRRPRPPAHPLFARPNVSYLDHLALPPPGTVVILSVPDNTIEPLASELAALGEPGGDAVALHLSGSKPAAALAPLSAVGYSIGSLHPLAAAAEATSGAERLRGAAFSFEGEAQAGEAAHVIVDAADGQLMELGPTDKTRYHAACVFAANYVTCCAAVAVRLLAEAARIDPSEAARALQPLWEGAVENLRLIGLPGALTGPISRGDASTVSGHLEALEGRTRELYRQLALEALAVAQAAGLDDDAARRIAALLDARGDSRES